MTDHHSLLDLRPAAMPGYMVPAWVSCLQAAIRDEGIVQAYRQDTGDQWQPGLTPLEQMIDRTTDREWQFITEFVQWFNVNVWGV